MLDLFLEALKYYGADFGIVDFLVLAFSREFMSLDQENLQWVHTDEDPLEFLQHAMAHAAYNNCAANNGWDPCSSLSMTAILNFIGAYGDSVWVIYDAVIKNGGSFDSVVPEKTSAVAIQVALGIISPHSPEWTHINTGNHPGYYGNASMYKDVPGGVDAFLAGRGMPVLWWYGDRDAGEDLAYVLTVNQASALWPYNINNPACVQKTNENQACGP